SWDREKASGRTIGALVTSPNRRDQAANRSLGRAPDPLPRGDTTVTVAKPIGLMTMADVAAALHVSGRTLQELIKTHPHYRLAGRKKLVTIADFNRLVEALPCPSGNFAEVAPGTSAAPSEARVFTRLLARTKKGRPKRSESSERASSSTVVSLELRQRRRSPLLPCPISKPEPA